MAKIKLKSKGTRINIDLKKFSVDNDKIAGNLRSRGYRVSPPMPNMPTVAISPDFKCMLSKDKLEIQIDEFENLQSKIAEFKSLIDPYTQMKDKFTINFDATFIVTGKYSLDDLMSTIFNPRAISKASLYERPVGFRVVIQKYDLPFIISFEGTRETTSSFTAITFSVNDKEKFIEVVVKIEQIISDFIKDILRFVFNEKNYRLSRKKKNLSNKKTPKIKEEM